MMGARRWTALFCAGIMTAFLLSGCRRSGEVGSVTSETAESNGSFDVNETESGEASAAQSGVQSAGSSDKSDGASTSSGSTVSGGKAATVDNPLKADLGGRTIIVSVTGSTDAQKSVDNTKDADNSARYFNRKTGVSLWYDAIAKRTATLEKELNCTIQLKLADTDEEAQKQAYAAIMSGSKYADIAITTTWRSLQYMTNGMALDLNQISTIDVSKDYMNPANIIQSSTIGSSTFLTSTNDFYAFISPIIYFNTRIIKEMGLESPYALVENDEWTLSKLRSMAKAATKEMDGIAGMSVGDQWGLASQDPSHTAGFATLGSYGAQLLTSDGKGNITYSADSQKVIDACNMARSLYFTDGISFYSEAYTQAQYIDLFVKGNVLFYVDYTKEARNFVDMEDDFGVVPYPRADGVNGYRSSVDHNAACVMLLKQSKQEDIEAAGAFVQAFCYLSDAVMEKRIEEFSNRYYRDDKSFNMLNIIAASNVTSPEMLLCANDSVTNTALAYGTNYVLYWGIKGTGAGSAQAVINERKSAAIANLNELLAIIKSKSQ